MTVTAKARAGQFWSWFGQQEEQFFLQLQQGQAALVQQAVNGRLRSLRYPLQCRALWDEEAKTANLIAGCGGDKAAQFLALFWKDRAPGALQNRWRFFPCLPGRAVPPQWLELEGVRFSASSWTVYWGKVPQAEKIDLQVYAPDSVSLPPMQRLRQIALYLRETLGEAFAEINTGTIQTLEELPARPPLGKTCCNFAQFAAGARALASKLSWTVCSDPTAVCYGYHVDRPAMQDGLREDITAGVTRNPRLLEEPTVMADAFRACGGCYAYFYYENPPLSAFELEAYRSQAAAEVERFLTDYNFGYLLGTASGRLYSYLDLMLFDPPSFSATFRNMCDQFSADLYLHSFGKPDYLQ